MATPPIATEGPTLPPTLEATLRRRERLRMLGATLWLVLVPALVVGAWMAWSAWERATTYVAEASRLRSRGALVDRIDGESLWWMGGPLAVDLSGTARRGRFDDDDLARLVRLRRVEELNLADLPGITDDGLAVLANLPDLRELYMGGSGRSRLTSASLAQIGKLRRLQILDLAGLPITDDGLVHLRTLKDLRFLNLEGTPVTDAGLDRLQALPNLEALDLRRTAVSPEGIGALQQARPTLQIFQDEADEEMSRPMEAAGDAY